MTSSGTTPLQVLQVSITMTMAAAMVSKQKHNDCKQKAEQRTDKTTKTQTTNNENYGDDEPKGPPCGDCKRPRLTLNTIPVGRYKDEKYLPYLKGKSGKVHSMQELPDHCEKKLWQQTKAYITQAVARQDP